MLFNNIKHNKNGEYKKKLPIGFVSITNVLSEIAEGMQHSNDKAHDPKVNRCLNIAKQSDWHKCNRIHDNCRGDCTIDHVNSSSQQHCTEIKQTSKRGGYSTYACSMVDEETKEEPEMVGKKVSFNSSSKANVCLAITLPAEIILYHLFKFLSVTEILAFETTCSITYSMTLQRPKDVCFQLSEFAAKERLLELQPLRKGLTNDEASWKHGLFLANMYNWNTWFCFDNLQSLHKQFKYGPLKANYTSNLLTQVKDNLLHGLHVYGIQGLGIVEPNEDVHNTQLAKNATFQRATEIPIQHTISHATVELRDLAAIQKTTCSNAGQTIEHEDKFGRNVLTLCKNSRDCDFDGLVRTVHATKRPIEVYFCAKASDNFAYSASVVLGNQDEINFKTVETTGYSNDVKHGILSSWCFGIDGQIKIFGPLSNGLMIQNVCPYEPNIWYAVQLVFNWTEKKYECTVKEGNSLFTGTQSLHQQNVPGLTKECFDSLPTVGHAEVSFWDTEIKNVSSLFIFNHSKDVTSWIDGIRFVLQTPGCRYSCQ